jgi:hypothetical protein
MKKHRTSLLSILTLALLAPAASAGVSLVATPVTLTNPTLVANHWIGLKLTLVATSDVAGIQGFDFTDPEGSHTVPLAGNGTIGISGTFHQAWNIDPTTSQDLPTASGVFPAASSSSVDSFFATLPTAFENVGGPNEDNNGLNTAANPPYTASPLTDIAPDPDTFTEGKDYGVGSLLTETARIVGTATAPQTFNLAFVIIPAGSAVTVNGVVVDRLGNSYDVNAVISTPEPGTLSLLGAFGGALLIRRSRKIRKSVD